MADLTKLIERLEKKASNLRDRATDFTWDQATGIDTAITEVKKFHAPQNDAVKLTPELLEKYLNKHEVECYRGDTMTGGYVDDDFDKVFFTVKDLFDTLKRIS